VAVAEGVVVEAASALAVRAALAVWAHSVALAVRAAV
jgi:hypothetical protein